MVLWQAQKSSAAPSLFYGLARRTIKNIFHEK